MGNDNSIRVFIQFRPYAGKYSILQEYENIGQGLGKSVVVNLVRKLPMIQTSNYHIFVDDNSQAQL